MLHVDRSLRTARLGLVLHRIHFLLEADVSGGTQADP